MLPNDVRRAWADRCGLAWDESDDRVREPEKYGWPHDFEIFYAGWKASYTTAQELVPESSGLPWTGDVQGRRPASCAPSESAPTFTRVEIMGHPDQPVSARCILSGCRDLSHASATPAVSANDVTLARTTLAGWRGEIALPFDWKARAAVHAEVILRIADRTVVKE
jgi:hypothetical protein